MERIGKDFSDVTEANLSRLDSEKGKAGGVEAFTALRSSSQRNCKTECQPEELKGNSPSVTLSRYQEPLRSLEGGEM